MTSKSVNPVSATGGESRGSDRSGSPSEDLARDTLVDQLMSEEDDLPDSENAPFHLSTTMSHPQEVVGISMKSPQTPAADRPWIFPEPIDAAAGVESLADEDLDDTTPPEDDQTQETGLDDSARAPAGDVASSLQIFTTPSRSDASRQTITDGLQQPRRRASSGPGAVAESLKKLIPDFSSLLSFKSSPLTNLVPSVKSQNISDSGRTKISLSQSQSNAAFQPSPLRNNELSSTEIRQHDTRHPAMSGDGNNSSVPSRDEAKPMPLRRSTSDNSLYLRRHLSAAASFDDTNRWDHIAEQRHVYLKAIAANFQDSRFRMPKLPSINVPTVRPAFSDRSKSDELRDNTMMNSGKPITDSGTGGASTVPMGRHGSEDIRAHHPIMTEASSKMTGDVIVLGGYRGSVLRSAKPPHRQLWVPVKVGLNIRKVNLEVGLTDDDEEQMSETIIPSGTLSHIGPFDICRRLIKHLRKGPNAKNGTLRVHDYGYDWRLSPDLLSKQLISFLESLKSNHSETPKKNRGALVIAHSLGGLITRHAVNQRPELFSGVIYAGSPQNCVNILGPLRNGDDVILSSRVLTAQVNFTMRTSFVLLPEDGRCFIDKKTGERYDVDFFDPKTWEEYRLSPCINPPFPPIPADRRKSLMETFSDNIPSFPALPGTKRSSWFNSKESSPSRAPSENSSNAAPKPDQGDVRPEGGVQQSLEPTMANSSSTQSHRTSLFSNNPPVATACTIPKEEATAYLTRTLVRTLAFKRALAYNSALEAVYPPVAIIFGKNTPTVFGARVASREAIKSTDAYDDLAFAAGDGVVLASAAQLPSGYRCVKGGWVKSDRVHVGLLGDLEGVGKCLNAVWDARQRGVGLSVE